MADANQCVLMPRKEAESVLVKMRALGGSVLKLQVLKIYHSHFLAKII